jgi:hypothetical protein
LFLEEGNDPYGFYRVAKSEFVHGQFMIRTQIQYALVVFVAFVGYLNDYLGAVDRVKGEPFTIWK